MFNTAKRILFGSVWVGLWEVAVFKSDIPDPILITGAARSGTSMVAGAIHLCGAWGGEMRGPNRHNPKGMFENARIVEGLMKPYLRELGVDPLGQYPLPDVSNMPIPTNWRARVEQIIQEQGYSGGPWFYKGAKMCLTWPLWHYAFPDAKWIIVRRATRDIVNSCLRTAFMRAFRNENNQHKVGVDNARDGWIWWVHQHEQRFVEMIQAGLNVKVVWPQRMVQGDYKQMYETVEWLGLKWSSGVLSFIDPKLWKAREGAKHGDESNRNRG
jgi:hypothetical protein